MMIIKVWQIYNTITNGIAILHITYGETGDMWHMTIRIMKDKESQIIISLSYDDVRGYMESVEITAPIGTFKIHDKNAITEILDQLEKILEDCVGIELFEYKLTEEVCGKDEGEK